MTVSKKYEGSIGVEFDYLPALIPQFINTKSDNPLERYNGASRRRIFHLDKDWSITISNSSYDEELNGEIVVPVKYEGKLTELDGASAPLPWLVGMASFGILRPLGAMLTASMVHNFAYQHGGLLYKKGDGALEFRSLPRDLADDLFRDIISTVNNIPVTAKIAWFAARLGYFGVRYAGKLRGGEFPAAAVAALAGILVVLWGYFALFGFSAGVIILAFVYLVISLVISSGKPEGVTLDSTGKTKEGREAT
jgi:hypothetical protein